MKMKKLITVILGCFILYCSACSEDDKNVVDNNIENNENGNENEDENEDEDSSVEILDMELKIIEYVNKERAKVGVPTLKIHKSLMKSADIRAKEVKETQQMTHIRPDGTSYSTAIKIPVKGSGENITMGNLPENAMGAWMESPAHKANILNKNYTHIGVGSQKFIPIIGGYVWVQIFARID